MHRLAALDQILDLPRALAALELRADDLVDVEEAVLLEPDLDERGLHAREHVVDDAEVDVPGDRPPLRPLEVDLGDAVVLEDRDALLADVDRDHQLALRRGQRRTLRRRPPARSAARGLPIRRSGAPSLLPCAARPGACSAAAAGGSSAPSSAASAPASGRASSYRVLRDFRGGASSCPPAIRCACGLRPALRLVGASGGAATSAAAAF